jgi:hypothetical protein
MDRRPSRDRRRVKERKTDREDAPLLLRLMREGNFPQTWLPSPENRDLRQLLWASPSIGTDAHADHESVAALGHESRQSCGASRGEPSSRNLCWPPVLAADVESRWELFDRINPTIPRETGLLIPSKRGGNRAAKY